MKKYRFRRWLRNWLSNFDADMSEPIQIHKSTASIRELSHHKDTMNFQLYRATGGYILEFHTYDRKNDEHNRNLHIITNEENLGESIAKIITIEMLRN